MPQAISVMYPFIRAELPGIPEPLLVAATADAVSDFISKSEVWKYTSPVLLDWTTALLFPAIVPGTDIPADMRVVRFDTVKYASDGVSLREIPFKTRQQLDGLYSDWEVKTGNTPLYWTMDGPDTPRIVPIATANVAGSIQVRSIVSSSSGLATLPDFIMDEYDEELRMGALARLMKIPGKDWTNMNLSAAYSAMFDAAITKAKSRAGADFGQPCRETSYGGI
jgi:hypothetical protein